MSSQSGWTLVDLMIGMAVGLFLCAVAGTLVLSQWREHRHLLAETLLQQELRNAIALMRHEVHRSGADPAAHELVPERGQATAPPPEAPRLQLLLEGAPIPDDRAGAGDGVSLTYIRSEPGEPRRRIERGFRLQGTQLQYLLERSWQPWTDSNAVRFIRMEVRLNRSKDALPESCTCASARRTPRSCEALLQAQVLHVLLVGQSRLEPRTVRSISSSIHVRNQRLEWPPSPC
ncbi:hypothetical protein H5407_14325 [Mitsuaria sp. WAJ17]|uniref:PilW family protein n=1 Tax=Mitsuaria sp. WAJ17 TaxID=2761452 RepID=UPI0016005927|nr:hypothetical protein [Mitsuaria sp. WAJ17]MBB2486397.1 hypothetical protein [Mitsuaria sp. WAJ17]